jgi:hypothetical protein
MHTTNPAKAPVGWLPALFCNVSWGASDAKMVFAGQSL